MQTGRLRLGQLLVDARMITSEALDDVLLLQKTDGRRLGTLLVERALINETQLTQILSHQLSVPWVSLLHIEFSRQLLNLVPRDAAERFCLVPIYVRHVRGQGQTLYVAMDDPSNEVALRECQAFSGLPVRAMIAPPTDIQNAIRVYYGGAQPKPAPAPSSAETTPLPRPTGDAPRARRSDRPARGRMPSGEFNVPPAPRPPALAAIEAPAAPEPAPPPAPVAPAAVEPAAVEPAALEPAAVAPPVAPQPPAVAAPEVEAAPDEVAARSEEAAVPAEIPKPRGGKAPRMVSLTLLDGTTITLPARKRARGEERAAPADARGSRPDEDVGLTARDLVAALRAVSHGADATEILGSNVRWEAMFAALLSVLLKKHLIADWEFVDEFKRI
jgi:type IV pilus assembly protein PilB